ncbi:MAG: beta-phosphoglucomutase [Phycisphaerae bacterium]
MTWTISESQFLDHPSKDRAALFAVGNGSVCSLGLPAGLSESPQRETYLAGCYTIGPLEMHWLMQAPAWRGAAIGAAGEMLPANDVERTLDMRSGVLSITARIEGAAGKFQITEQRFASMADPTLLAQRWTVRVLECVGPVEFWLGLDGDVVADRTKYYKDLDVPCIEGDTVRLSRVDTLAVDTEGVECILVSPQTGRRTFASARITPRGPARDLPPADHTGKHRVGKHYRFDAAADEHVEYTFEKLCVVTGDSPDRDAVSAGREAAKRLAETDWDRALADHRGKMDEFWSGADVEIAGDERSQQAIRFAIWSTRIAAPSNDGISSIGARNLCGDFCRGGVFWDMEMFQLPMLTAGAPDLARNHIRFRRRWLDIARSYAAQDGYSGAWYPWTAYRQGRDDPRNNPNHFLRQEIHINLAVAWGILHYWRMTDDDSTMVNDGLPVLVEVARFMAGRTDGPDADGKYHLRDVCGPDEFSLHVTDNAYTNCMTRWVLRQAGTILRDFEAAGKAENLSESLGVDADELTRWGTIAEFLHVPMTQDGTLEQFDGFETETPEVDLVVNGGRWGRIDKTGKQADTLMLAHALPELFDADQLRKCWDLYAPLCMHFSSLSYNTHALIATRLGLTRDAERFFRLAEGIDLEGGAGEGIHGAGQGGYWQDVISGFGGLHLNENGLTIAPALPGFWDGMKYRAAYRGQLLEVDVKPAGVAVTNKGDEAVQLELIDQWQTIEPGATVERHHAARWTDQDLECVIFDLDGVLVTTDKFHYLAWKELADELGLDFDEEVNHRLRGISRAESLKVIYEHNNADLPDEEEFARQMTSKNDRYRKLIGTMTPDDVLPGALDLLNELREAGIKCAIASASRNTPLVLERTDLRKYFDAVSDGNCILHSKPSPEVFEVAAQRTRTLAWNCLGIEDAAAGVEAIKRAGMVAVGIAESAREADVCFDDTTQLSLKVLRDAFEKHKDRR